MLHRKFGFPETTGSYRRAFRVLNSGKGIGVRLDALSNYMNGVGTFCHHSSGAYLIVACATHLMPLDRRVLSMSLPLVVQHLVVLVKYHSTVAYGLCELAIEIWWEWEIFANLGDLSVENGYDLTTRGIALTMAFSHWMYWGAALVKLASKQFISTDEIRKFAEFANEMQNAEEGMSLTYEDFEVKLESRGIHLEEEERGRVFEIADEDGSGTIDKQEFGKLVDLMKLLKKQQSSGGEAEEIFERALSEGRRGTASTSLSPLASVRTDPLGALVNLERSASLGSNGSNSPRRARFGSAPTAVSAARAVQNPPADVATTSVSLEPVMGGV